MIMRYNPATPSNGLATDLLTVRVQVFKQIVFCHVLPIVRRNSMPKSQRFKVMAEIEGTPGGGTPL